MPDKSDIKFEQPSQILLIANQYLWVLLFVVMLVTLVLGYFVIIQPALKNNNQAKKNVNDVIGNQSEVENLITKASALNSRYKSIQNRRTNDLKKLKQIIPQEPAIAELFVMAERLAVEQDFELSVIDVSNIVTKQTGNDDNQLATKGLDSLMVNMSVSRIIDEDHPLEVDSYDAFKNYLSDLENNLRLMDIQTVSFSGVGVPDAANLSFDFTIITYFISEEKINSNEEADANQVDQIKPNDIERPVS